MFPKYHVLFSLVSILILDLIFPSLNLIQLGLIFLSSILIDFDHYIYHSIKKKEFNLFKIYNTYKLRKQKKKNSRGEFYCFHGVEPIIVSLILGFLLNNYFYFIGIGILLHLALDWIEMVYYNQPLFKISIFYDLLKQIKLNKL